MNTRVRPLATCHPDQPHYARGLCERCWEAARRARRGQTVRIERNGRAVCHPDRAHVAKGLCSTCYSREVNPERKRKSRLAVYGLTPEAYAAMETAQGSRCAICGTVPKVRLNVDHDHRTGEVRGLLCDPCNRGIGLLRDDPDVIAAAALYVQKRMARSA